MSSGIKPSFVFPTEAKPQTRSSNSNSNNTTTSSHAWSTQPGVAVPSPPRTLRPTAATSTSSSSSSSPGVNAPLSTHPALSHTSASLPTTASSSSSKNNNASEAATTGPRLPAPPPPPARRYREMGATPVLLPECLAAAANAQAAQMRHSTDASQPRRRRSGDAGPQAAAQPHHHSSASSSMSSGSLPSIPAHLQKRSSTVQAAAQGRVWQPQAQHTPQQQQSQRRRGSVNNMGSANNSGTTAPLASASEESSRAPTSHSVRRSVSFIVPDEVARPGLSDLTRLTMNTAAAIPSGKEAMAEMSGRTSGGVQQDGHALPAGALHGAPETMPAPAYATPIIVHRPPTRHTSGDNGNGEACKSEQGAGQPAQMSASLAATERRSKAAAAAAAAANNNNANTTASTPQKAEGGTTAGLSFRDRVNKGIPPPPRTRLPRRRAGKRRTPQGSLGASAGGTSSGARGGGGERRRRVLGHTSTSLLAHGVSGPPGLHGEADWQRGHGLRVLLYVTWFHTRLMRIVRRARAQQHWQRVLAPRAAFVLQCFWRRVRQRRRVRRLCAVRLLVPWLRLKLTRLRRAKEASARLLQRVFRAERTRVWMRGLYDYMYVHRALRLLQRHVRRWEDQKLLRFLRSQREERNLLIERCRRESARLVRGERAGWLALLRTAHEQLGFTASDPTAVITHVEREQAADTNQRNSEKKGVRVVVRLGSALHTLEGSQAYLVRLFTAETEDYLSAYIPGHLPRTDDGDERAQHRDEVEEDGRTAAAADGQALGTLNSNHHHLPCPSVTSGDDVLDAFVELLGRVEAMERKELERDLLHEHAVFCEPVRRISYAIRLRTAVPRLYASLLLSLPTVADMRRAVELFYAEQRARTAIVAEYNAIPLLALNRPAFSATAEQRHRTLLALMSLADEAADATNCTAAESEAEAMANEESRAAVRSASLALYEEEEEQQQHQQGGGEEKEAATGDRTSEAALLRQMRAAVQSERHGDEPHEEGTTSRTPAEPTARRLRVVMQPQLMPVDAPGAVSPVPLLQMRAQLMRRRQRIHLSAATTNTISRTCSGRDKEEVQQAEQRDEAVSVPPEEETCPRRGAEDTQPSSQPQSPLPRLRAESISHSVVRAHERRWHAASSRATNSDWSSSNNNNDNGDDEYCEGGTDDDDVSAMESVGWGAAEVGEQTESKSSTTLNAAASPSVAQPQPPSPPPRRRHHSHFENAASLTGVAAAENDTP